MPLPLVLYFMPVFRMLVCIVAFLSAVFFFFFFQLWYYYFFFFYLLFFCIAFFFLSHFSESFFVIFLSLTFFPPALCFPFSPAPDPASPSARPLPRGRRGPGAHITSQSARCSVNEDGHVAEHRGREGTLLWFLFYYIFFLWKRIYSPS